MKKFGIALLAALFALSGGLSLWRPSPAGLITPAAAQEEPDDDVEDDIEDDIEDDVETDIEDDVEAEVEDDIESAIEDALEDDLEGDIEDNIESEIEDDVEDSIEDDVEDSLEGEVEDEIEDEVEEDVEDDADEDFDEGDLLDDDDDIDDDVEDEDEGKEGSDEDEVAELTLNSAESLIFDIDFDDAGDEIRADENILILAPESVALLEKRGYEALEITPLEGLGLILARIERPPGRDLEAEALAAQMADPSAEIDFNHLYRVQGNAASNQTAGQVPASFIEQNHHRRRRARADVKLGLIDTAVDLAHPALADRIITQADFVDGASRKPAHHGTAVASILIGRDGGFSGLLPEASLYAASVFVEHPTAGVVATTSSILRALDWMVLNDVPVVNMSLAGPPNRIVEAAINRALEKGVIVVAAAGNEGPTAAPRYPAAYDNVIAITAINQKNRVYRLAVRGPHIDFAAPGVDIVAAKSPSDYSSETGTSIAAPFATAIIASCCEDRLARRDFEGLLNFLATKALDLGPEGFDPVYGYGLIQP